MQQCLWGGVLWAGVLWVGAVAAQPMYKSVGPDGKVTYSDKPPAPGSQVVREMPAAPPGGPRPAPQIQGAPPILPSVPFGNAGPSQAMQDYQACTRANAKALELMRAAAAVEQSVRSAKTSPLPGNLAEYRRTLLERQFAHYQSLGGTAATPESVEVPPDPCRQSFDALRQDQGANYAKYKECTAAHAKEVRLSGLAFQIVESNRLIAAAERMQSERRNNPEKFAEKRADPQWAKLESEFEPARLRAGTAALFAEYRAAGGTATRSEDVTSLPNPCVQNLPGLPARSEAPSSVTRQSTLIAPGR